MKERFVSGKSLHESYYVGEVIESNELLKNNISSSSCYLWQYLKEASYLKRSVVHSLFKLFRVGPASTLQIYEQTERSGNGSGSVLFLSVDALSWKSFLTVWIVHCARSGELVNIVDSRYFNSWVDSGIRALSNLIPSRSKLIPFSQHERLPTIDLPPGVNIYTCWSSVEIFDNFHVQLTHYPDPIPAGITFSPDLWDWVRFDKVESEFSKFQKPYLLAAAMSFIVAADDEELKDADDVITATLNLVNFYRVIFSHSEVAHGLRKLMDSATLTLRDGKVVVCDAEQIDQYQAGMLPFGGVLGLTATGILNMTREQAFGTYEEFKEAIVKLESILPIRDQLQIVYLDEVDEIETYYYMTIQKFVQEQILDKQNHDKFSDWWDLAQDGKRSNTVTRVTV